jgi:3-oxoacyl-[acyl-carrier-protein] synthase-1
MQKTYLNACGILCALGDNPEQVKARLFAGQSGVAPTTRFSPGRALPLGSVDAVLPALDRLPPQHRSRNNALALAALAHIRPAVDAACARYGAGRIGVVIGTSTSGIGETERALRHHAEHGAMPADFAYAVQEMGSPAAMLARELGIAGPAYVHSSACASSAKAMASAARLIRMGVCDAVVTGGVDTLCDFTVAGFAALESVSAEQCNPMSVNRSGINIGEGARLAIGQALTRAGVNAAQVDYINLHGTATKQNDAMESQVIASLFGLQVPVSSTKPFTGHTLGAAAAIEAALCWLVMQDANPEGHLPPHLWDGAADPALPALNLARPGAALGRPVRHVLSTSFAFGGSNAALLLGRVQ